ncbi:unnamed protein product, partial [Closterium sp. NIES-54]
AEAVHDNEAEGAVDGGRAQQVPGGPQALRPRVAPHRRAHRQQDRRADPQPRAKVLHQVLPYPTRSSCCSAPPPSAQLERDGTSAATSQMDIEIPPPRPKRKPAHPYPRKAGSASSSQPQAPQRQNSQHSLSKALQQPAPSLLPPPPPPPKALLPCMKQLQLPQPLSPPPQPKQRVQANQAAAAQQQAVAREKGNHKGRQATSQQRAEAEESEPQQHPRSSRQVSQGLSSQRTQSQTSRSALPVSSDQSCGNQRADDGQESKYVFSAPPAAAAAAAPQTNAKAEASALPSVFTSPSPLASQRDAARGDACVSPYSSSPMEGDSGARQSPDQRSTLKLFGKTLATPPAMPPPPPPPAVPSAPLPPPAPRSTNPAASMSPDGSPARSPPLHPPLLSLATPPADLAPPSGAQHWRVKHSAGEGGAWDTQKPEFKEEEEEEEEAKEEEEYDGEEEADEGAPMVTRSLSLPEPRSVAGLAEESQGLCLSDRPHAAPAAHGERMAEAGARGRAEQRGIAAAQCALRSMSVTGHDVSTSACGSFSERSVVLESGLSVEPLPAATPLPPPAPQRADRGGAAPSAAAGAHPMALGGGDATRAGAAMAAGAGTVASLSLAQAPYMNQLFAFPQAPPALPTANAAADAAGAAANAAMLSPPQLEKSAAPVNAGAVAGRVEEEAEVAAGEANEGAGVAAVDGGVASPTHVASGSGVPMASQWSPSLMSSMAGLSMLNAAAAAAAAASAAGANTAAAPHRPPFDYGAAAAAAAAAASARGSTTFQEAAATAQMAAAAAMGLQFPGCFLPGSEEAVQQQQMLFPTPFPFVEFHTPGFHPMHHPGYLLSPYRAPVPHPHSAAAFQTFDSYLRIYGPAFASMGASSFAAWHAPRPQQQQQQQQQQQLQQQQQQQQQQQPCPGGAESPAKPVEAGAPGGPPAGLPQFATAAAPATAPATTPAAAGTSAAAVAAAAASAVAASAAPVDARLASPPAPPRTLSAGDDPAAAAMAVTMAAASAWWALQGSMPPGVFLPMSSAQAFRPPFNGIPPLTAGAAAMQIGWPGAGEVEAGGNGEGAGTDAAGAAAGAVAAVAAPEAGFANATFAATGQQKQQQQQQQCEMAGAVETGDDGGEGSSGKAIPEGAQGKTEANDTAYSASQSQGGDDALGDNDGDDARADDEEEEEEEEEEEGGEAGEGEEEGGFVALVRSSEVEGQEELRLMASEREALAAMLQGVNADTVVGSSAPTGASKALDSSTGAEQGGRRASWHGQGQGDAQAEREAGKARSAGDARPLVHGHRSQQHTGQQREGERGSEGGQGRSPFEGGMGPCTDSSPSVWASNSTPPHHAHAPRHTSNGHGGHVHTPQKEAHRRPSDLPHNVALAAGEKERSSNNARCSAPLLPRSHPAATAAAAATRPFGLPASPADKHSGGGAGGTAVNAATAMAGAAAAAAVSKQEKWRLPRERGRRGHAQAHEQAQAHAHAPTHNHGHGHGQAHAERRGLNASGAAAAAAAGAAAADKREQSNLIRKLRSLEKFKVRHASAAPTTATAAASATGAATAAADEASAKMSACGPGMGGEGAGSGGGEGSGGEGNEGATEGLGGGGEGRVAGVEGEGAKAGGGEGAGGKEGVGMAGENEGPRRKRLRGHSVSGSNTPPPTTRQTLPSGDTPVPAEGGAGEAAAGGEGAEQQGEVRATPSSSGSRGQNGNGGGSGSGTKHEGGGGPEGSGENGPSSNSSECGNEAGRERLGGSSDGGTSEREACKRRERDVSEEGATAKSAVKQLPGGEAGGESDGKDVEEKEEEMNAERGQKDSNNEEAGAGGQAMEAERAAEEEKANEMERGVAVEERSAKRRKVVAVGAGEERCSRVVGEAPQGSSAPTAGSRSHTPLSLSTPHALLLGLDARHAGTRAEGQQQKEGGGDTNAADGLEQLQLLGKKRAGVVRGASGARKGEEGEEGSANEARGSAARPGRTETSQVVGAGRRELRGDGQSVFRPLPILPPKVMPPHAPPRLLPPPPSKPAAPRACGVAQGEGPQSVAAAAGAVAGGGSGDGGDGGGEAVKGQEREEARAAVRVEAEVGGQKEQGEMRQQRRGKEKRASSSGEVVRQESRKHGRDESSEGEEWMTDRKQQHVHQHQHQQQQPASSSGAASLLAGMRMVGPSLPLPSPPTGDPSSSNSGGAGVHHHFHYHYHSAGSSAKHRPASSKQPTTAAAAAAIAAAAKVEAVASAAAPPAALSAPSGPETPSLRSGEGGEGYGGMVQCSKGESSDGGEGEGKEAGGGGRGGESGGGEDDAMESAAGMEMRCREQGPGDITARLMRSVGGDGAGKHSERHRVRQYEHKQQSSHRFHPYSPHKERTEQRSAPAFGATAAGPPHTEANVDMGEGEAKDFYTWSLELELLLQNAQVFHYFDKSYSGPAEDTADARAQYYNESLMAYGVLLRNMSLAEQLSIRSNKTTSAPALGTWRHLNGVYQLKDSVSSSRLLQQLLETKMAPREKANSYINRCRSLRDQIAKLGSTISEEILENIVIQGLSPKWRPSKALLRQQGVISEAALCAALLVEQRDMDQQQPAP